MNNINRNPSNFSSFHINRHAKNINILKQVIIKVKLKQKLYLSRHRKIP